jgi:hypothetical protein
MSGLGDSAIAIRRIALVLFFAWGIRPFRAKSGGLLCSAFCREQLWDPTFVRRPKSVCDNLPA